MRLEIYRSLWGVLSSTDGALARSPVCKLEDALPLLKRLGYNGIEVPFKMVYFFGEENFKNILKENNMKVIFQIFSDGPVCPGSDLVLGGPYNDHPKPGKTVQDHFNVFKRQVEAINEFDYDQITHVNSHSIRDSFSFEQAEDFFNLALNFQKEIGIDVLHETHRKRFFHSPWYCRDFLDDKFHELNMVADLSHFTCVAETSPMDEELTEIVKKIAPRIKHIHARVGYDHGPQINDPRAPENELYLLGFESWWQSIWEHQFKAGTEVITLTPEHGPPSYQHTVPYSKEPLANIWEVNHFIALRAQQNFAKLYGQKNSSNLIEEKN